MSQTKLNLHLQSFLQTACFHSTVSTFFNSFIDHYSKINSQKEMKIKIYVQSDLK